MTQSVDSAGAHTDRSCAELVRRGIVGALRYQYNTSAAEVERLHAYGLSFGLIFELNGNAAVRNPEAGADHARQGVAFARRLGMPQGCGIYYAEADTHVRIWEFPGASRYWELAASITRAAGYRCGAYGGSLLIDHLHARGIVDLTWQTAAGSWNEYQSSASCVLRQLVEQPTLGGVVVDLNDVLADDWGQWTPTGSVFRPPTTATEPTNIEEIAAMPYAFDVDGHQYHLTDALELVALTDGGRKTLLDVGTIDLYPGHPGTGEGKGDEWITFVAGAHDAQLATLRPIIAAGGLRTF